MSESVKRTRKKKGSIEEQSPLVAVKSIFKSKTFWVNLLAFIAFVIQNKYGFVVSESTQAEALMLINIVLRSITKEEVKWK